MPENTLPKVSRKDRVPNNSSSAHQATVPVYLSEFCDPASRGFYVSAYNVGYPVGACFFVLLAAALHGHWRASFAAAVVPGVFMLIQLAFLPESPRFLAVSGQHEKASGVVDLMYTEGFL